MKPKKIKFPDNFYWGSATSAHQVEGDNRNDWSEWEIVNASRLALEAKTKWQNWQIKKFPEMLRSGNYISGRACDHYGRFEEDFDIAKSLNHNAHRFSVEWSRVEPKKGEFDEKQIEHYQKVLKALKKRGLEPFVTLWHWTNPIWIRDIGGWENEKTVEYFTRFVGKIINKMGRNIKFWVTLNEPNVYLANSYLLGIWSPEKKSLITTKKVYKNFAKAHKKAYWMIHEVDNKSAVGFANNIKFIEPKYWFCLLDQAVSRIYKYLSNNKFFRLVDGEYDFIGCNYYFHDKIRFNFIKRNENEKISDLNWEVYPEGIYHVLKDLKKYNRPIYVTENGIADKSDQKRSKFIKEHLFWMHKAIAEGVDVRGYFYWSLLDNFEWDKGFWPRFVLVGIDYETQKRTIRKSARGYAKICKTNTLI